MSVIRRVKLKYSLVTHRFSCKLGTFNNPVTMAANYGLYNRKTVIVFDFLSTRKCLNNSIHALNKTTLFVFNPY